MFPRMRVSATLYYSPSVNCEHCDTDQRNQCGQKQLGLVQLFPLHIDSMGLEKINKKFNLLSI